MRFIFVLGSPRSGTTLAGSLVGSAQSVYYPGEYHAFYLTRDMIPKIMRRVPSSLREQYVRELMAHATTFAVRCASDAGARTFCDASPWNLLIAQSFSVSPKNSTFLLCVRHPAGVIQSLAQSYASGYRWAGRSLEARARLYAAFYESAAMLPRDRTVVFDYDEFCVRPEAELTMLTEQLTQLLDEDHDAFDWRVAAIPHAPNNDSGAPIGYIDSEGLLRFRPRPSYDSRAWTREDDTLAAPIVAKGLAAIRALRPTATAAMSAFP
jgi:hypothetical protein